MGPPRLTPQSPRPNRSSSTASRPQLPLQTLFITPAIATTSTPQLGFVTVLVVSRAHPGSHVTFPSNPYLAPSLHSPPSRVAPPTIRSADLLSESASLNNGSAPLELENGGAEDHVIAVDDIALEGPDPHDVTGHFSDLFIGLYKGAVTVAMKRPRIGKRSSHGQEIEKLEREAAMWLRLHHPHILPFMGICRANDYTYLVSPFMANGNLADYIRRYPDRERTSFILETADAVAFLHAKDVVHSDIKACNILVSESHQALLCDFGLAKYAHSITASASKGQGSVRWQSPEVVNGTSRSFASDTYAFGITISEVLSVAIPFSHLKGQPAVIQAVSFRGERPARSPNHSRTGEPYETYWTVATQCWDEDPQCRPRMSDVYDQLRGDHPTSPAEAFEGPQSGKFSPTGSLLTVLEGDFDDASPTLAETASSSGAISIHSLDSGLLLPKPLGPSAVPSSMSPRLLWCISLEATVGFLSIYLLLALYAFAPILAGTYSILAHLQTQPTRMAHADTRPGSVLVNVQGDALLSDFELAFLDDECQYTPSHGGRFCYMAPGSFLRVQRACSDVGCSSASLVLEILSNHLPHGGPETGNRTCPLMMNPKGPEYLLHTWSTYSDLKPT